MEDSYGPEQHAKEANNEPDYYDEDYDGQDFGEWVTCWHCMGEGGFHDCGEDCCPCLRPELNETCPECKGRGGWSETV